MAIEWDHNWIDERVREFTNANAQRLDTIAQDHIGGDFATAVTQADEDNPSAFVTVPPMGLIREYGTSQDEPEPWAIPALIEASNGV